MLSLARGMLFERGETMKKKNKTPISEDLCIDPEARLCDQFDAVSIAKFPVAAPGKMGVRVVDNCAEDHIM